MRPLARMILVPLCLLLAACNGSTAPSAVPDDESLTVVIEFPATFDPAQRIVATVSAVGAAIPDSLDFDVDFQGAVAVDSTRTVVDGLFSVEVIAGDDANVIEVFALVWSRVDDDLFANSEHVSYRNPSIDLVEREITSLAATTFAAQTEPDGPSSQRHLDEHYREFGGIDPVDDSYVAFRETTVGGMQASGRAATRVTSTFLLTGPRSFDTTFAVQASGEASLTDPSDLRYSFGTSSGGDGRVDFVVWGRRGDFSLTFDLPSMEGVFTELELWGSPFDDDAENLEICFENGVPCSAQARRLTVETLERTDGPGRRVQVSGALPAGEYTLDLSGFSSADFSSFGGSEPREGSATWDFEMSTLLRVVSVE